MSMGMDPVTGAEVFEPGSAAVSTETNAAVGLATATTATTATTTAANQLTAGWAARIADGESTVFSGAGVWPLLGLLALGADEPGRTELAAAYGLDPAVASTATRRFVDLFDWAPALRAAIGLWYREELPVLDSWLDQLPPATRGRLSGAVIADKERLDAWAQEHTDGMIEEMTVDLDKDTMLVLASAIMVQTTWLHEFFTTWLGSQTGPWATGNEYASLYRSVQPEVIRVVDTGPETGQVTIATVEGNDDIDVLLFLGGPDASAAHVLRAGISAGISASGQTSDSLSGPGITVKTVESFAPETTHYLYLPKFTINAEHDLLDNADLFGLTSVSRPMTSNFSKIAAADLSVGSARQSAMAEFSETGFRAAAVTAIEFMVGSARPAMNHQAQTYSITFDRPFGFAAVHRPTGLVLVAGWVADVIYHTDAPLE